jgi:hypothetical protein
MQQRALEAFDPQFKIWTRLIGAVNCLRILQFLED